MSKYVCINGNIKPATDQVINYQNRSFRYGDGIIETIRCLNSTPLFFEKHYRRISSALHYLKMPLSEEFGKDHFRFHIEKLLQKNRIYKGAKCRIAFYRRGSGLYTPSSNSSGYLIEVTTLDEEFYTLPESGVTIGIYSENRKPIEPLSALKTSSALFYVLAGIWKSENNLNDCFILNTEGKIIEALTSNIVLVKDNELFFTTNDCGCVDGTMQRTLLDVVKSNKIKYHFVPGFSENHLLDGDEILLTNAVQGINYVGAYKNRRYYNTMAKKLIRFLNQQVGIEINKWN